MTMIDEITADYNSELLNDFVTINALKLSLLHM